MPAPNNQDKLSRKTKKKAAKQPTPISFLRSLTTNKSKKIISLCKDIAEDSNWELRFLLEEAPKKSEKWIRPILNKEALCALQSNKPKLCIRLINAYFCHYSNNSHANLIKAQANYSLQKNQEALKSLKILAAQQESKYYSKASELCKVIIAEEASKISQDTSPENAVKHYIVELLKLRIPPTYHVQLDGILEKVDSTIELSTYSELRRHELHLRFNTQLLHFFEEKLKGKTI